MTELSTYNLKMYLMISGGMSVKNMINVFMHTFLGIPNKILNPPHYNFNDKNVTFNNKSQLNLLPA